MDSVFGSEQLTGALLDRLTFGRVRMMVVAGSQNQGNIGTKNDGAIQAAVATGLRA